MKEQIQPFKVLVVEDNPADRYLLQQMLVSLNFPNTYILEAERLSDAICYLQTQTASLVFLDLSLPDSFGIDTFLQIKHLVQKIPVIVLTGLDDAAVASAALEHGAQDYLVKGEFNSRLLMKATQYSMERKKAEEKLLVSEAKYRQIFYRNPFPMWIYDADTSAIMEVNAAALKKYGYTHAEFLKLTLEHIHHPNSQELMKPFRTQATDNLSVHQKKNGDPLIVEFTSYAVDYFDKKAIQVQIHDVTEKLVLEKEIAQKKRQIIKAVLTAREQERKKIGEELHDNINQILTAIKLTLGFVLDNEAAKGSNLLAKCLHNTSLAIEEIRRLSKALILPGNLKELGLLASLDILIKDIRTVTQLDIFVNANAFAEERLNEEQKVALYRIIQEQLNNVLKYANASEANIYLQTIEDRIQLMICDNGKGFDTTQKSKGIGLHNIASRAELFHGYIKVDSSPGNGCQLVVVLSLNAATAKEAA